MRRRITKAVTLAASGAIVLGALATTAISASAAGRTTSRVVSKASSVKALKGTFEVAVMAPYTGGDASEGAMVSAGAKMALQIINNTGGIGGKKLTLEYLDTKGDPTTAATVAAEVVGQYESGQVQVALGPSDSDETLAAVPVLQRAGVPVINTTASSPAITAEHFTDFVRLVQSDVIQATQIIDFAAFNLNKKSLAIVYENNDYGQGVMQYELKAAKADGAKVVSVQTYTPNVDTNFATQITAMAKAKPDGVILDTSYTEGGEILRQAYNLGFTNVAWVGAGDNLYQDFITLANGHANGVDLLTVFNDFGTATKTMAFIRPFEAKYHTVPAEGAWTAYDALLMIQKRIDTGATRADLIARIKASSFLGAGGTYTFDKNGDVSAKPMFVITVKDKKFEPTSEVVKLSA